MHFFRGGNKEKRAKECSQKCICALGNGTLDGRRNFSINGAEISHWCFLCVNTRTQPFSRYKAESRSSFKGHGMTELSLKKSCAAKRDIIL